MDYKKIVRAGYNTIAPSYLKARAGESRGEDIQQLDQLLRRLSPDACVLDAGCGAGVPITRLLSHSFPVTGVDFSEAQLRLARRLVPRARFVCQDITTLSFVDAAFDAICSYYAIIHIPRQEHRVIFSNFYRMLKPSGLALLCLGAEDLEEDVEEYHGAPMYWSHYDAQTNLHLLEECGLHVIRSGLVSDPDYPDAVHLFVLAQKKRY